MSTEALPVNQRERYGMIGLGVFAALGFSGKPASSKTLDTKGK
jgi:hypothetical protein